MHDILIFIAGVAFVILMLPIAQSISDMVCGFCQWIISSLNVKVTRNNVEVQDLNNSVEPTNAQAIGFQMPNELEYYDDDEEPDNENKQKVGF